MQTSIRGAVRRVSEALESIEEFRDEVYMTIGPATMQPPLLIWDLSDIGTSDDASNRGDFISTVTVTIQIWALGTDEAFRLTDKLHKTLRAADLVLARDNVFTLSEEYMPLDPGMAPGILRVMSTYRLGV